MKKKEMAAKLCKAKVARAEKVEDSKEIIKKGKDAVKADARKGEL